MPISRANEALPGTLKRGLINGSNSNPEVRMKPVALSTSAAIKNGKSEGKITCAHKVRPFVAAARTVPDMRIRQKIKMIQIAGTSSCLMYITLDGWSNIIIITAAVMRVSAKVILINSLLSVSIKFYYLEAKILLKEKLPLREMSPFRRNVPI